MVTSMVSHHTCGGYIHHVVDVSMVSRHSMVDVSSGYIHPLRLRSSFLQFWGLQRPVLLHSGQPLATPVSGLSYAPFNCGYYVYGLLHQWLGMATNSPWLGICFEFCCTLGRALVDRYFIWGLLYHWLLVGRVCICFAAL